MAEKPNVSEGLFLLHVRNIQSAQKIAAEGTSKVRNARKAAKSDGVNLAVLDHVVGLSKLDEHELTFNFNEIVTYAKYLEIPVYRQLSLFDAPAPKEEDIIDLAAVKGLRAGKMGQGQETNPYEPGSPAGQEWLSGWHRGQEIILQAGITPIPEEPEKPSRKAKETAH